MPADSQTLVRDPLLSKFVYIESVLLVTGESSSVSKWREARAARGPAGRELLLAIRKLRTLRFPRVGAAIAITTQRDKRSTRTAPAASTPPKVGTTTGIQPSRNPPTHLNAGDRRDVPFFWNSFSFSLRATVSGTSASRFMCESSTSECSTRPSA